MESCKFLAGYEKSINCQTVRGKFTVYDGKILDLTFKKCSVEDDLKLIESIKNPLLQQEGIKVSGRRENFISLY